MTKMHSEISYRYFFSRYSVTFLLWDNKSKSKRERESEKLPVTSFFNWTTQEQKRV